MRNIPGLTNALAAVIALVRVARGRRGLPLIRTVTVLSWPGSRKGCSCLTAQAVLHRSYFHFDNVRGKTQIEGEKPYKAGFHQEWIAEASQHHQVINACGRSDLRQEGKQLHIFKLCTNSFRRPVQPKRVSPNEFKMRREVSHENDQPRSQPSASRELEQRTGSHPCTLPHSAGFAWDRAQPNHAA